VGMHPLTRDPGEVCQVEDPVRAGPDDHALGLHFGNNRRAAEPLTERGPLGWRKLEEEIRVYAFGEAGLIGVVALMSTRASKHTALRVAGRSTAVFDATAQLCLQAACVTWFGLAGSEDGRWRCRQQTAFPRPFVRTSGKPVARRVCP
jgi:hypothetical protein